jgi:TPR repeat protein
MFLNGEGTPKDLIKARTTFETACQLESGSACYDLGVMYWNGEGTPKDKVLARKTFKRGCELGYQKSCDQKDK